MSMDDDGIRLPLRRRTLEAIVTHGTLGGQVGGGRMALLDRLLDAAATDPGVLTALSPSELFFTLQHIGPEDAAPLLSLASDEQLGRLPDFTAWEGERFAAARFARWVDLAAAEDSDTALRLLAVADPELLALHVLSLATIEEVDGTPEQADRMGSREDVLGTPDGRFWLISTPGDPDTLPRLRRFVDLLYALDAERARELLKAAGWELPSSLEDELLRLRTARLGEEGFPPPEEALRLYRALDLEKLRSIVAADRDGLTVPRPLPGSHLVWRLAGADPAATSFLTRALATLRDGPRKTAVVQSLAHLLGEAVMAETRGDLEDTAAAVRAPARVHGMLSVALEDLGGPDPSVAAALLLRVHPRVLFRAGSTLLLGVREKARRLLVDAGRELGFRLLDDPPLGPAVDAAAGFVPQVHAGLDRPGAAELREVASLADVRRLREVLEEASARLAFVRERLGGEPAALGGLVLGDSRGHVSCGTLAATSVLAALLDLPPLTPLRPRQVAEATDLLMPWDAAGGRRLMDPGIRAALERRLGAETPAVRRLFDEALANLRVALEALPPGQEPDPRFLGGLLLAAGGNDEARLPVDLSPSA